MTRLGYVVIEYNQASHWPGLTDGAALFDRYEEAMADAKRLAEDTGRGEKFAVAEVELIEYVS